MTKSFLAKKLSLYFPYLIILAVVAILYATNLKADTYLTGWDNLHPEFNFWINIKRSIFAVWQEYQGVGLLGGMGHAAGLLHQIYILILSLILPQSLLRYTWTFLCLLIGGLGAYQLALNILSNNKEASFPKRLAAASAGLFYIFNLSTLQTFYIPFETFTAHFAFLPWIVWSAMRFLSTKTWKSLLIFSLISLAGTISYYVPTLFLVTLLALGILSLVHLIYYKNLHPLFNVAKLFFATILVNSFWLLPFLYFTFTNASVVPTAKINEMSSTGVFLENKNFGNIQDVAILRGLWFDRTDINLSGQSDYLMAGWREYAYSIPFQVVGWIFFALIIFGLYSSIKSRNRLQITSAALFVFAFTMLMVNTPPFSWIVALFRNSLPFFAEAFRFPFTKFSILASLSYALLLSTGTHAIFKIIPRRLLKNLFCGVIVAVLLVYLFPLYQGKLFYAREQSKIPPEYFQTFEFFKKQNPNTRIANFPQYTFWSWNYYWWGYEGSGFLWYGINQPILDRAFDPWSNYNEGYYWELSHALYSKNPQTLSEVLEKYQVNWLLVDKNVFSSINQKTLYTDELEGLLEKSNKATLAQQFGNIDIYKVNLSTQVNNFVFSADNLPGVEPKYSFASEDKAFSLVGHYSSLGSNYYYPFRSLLTAKNADDKRDFAISENADTLTISADVPTTVASPVFPDESKELPSPDPKDLRKVTYFKPQAKISDNKIAVDFPKVSGYFSGTIDLAMAEQNKYCTGKNAKKSSTKTASVENKSVLELQSKGALCGVSVWLPNLQHNYAYIIAIDSKNNKGQSLFFWLENPINRKADIETRLPQSNNLQTTYFIQPPMEDDGVGYTLHVENRSIGNDLTVNDLGEIRVYTFPYKYLSGIYFGDGSNANVQTQALETQHPDQATYIVNLTDQLPKTIVLSQGFNTDWQAYETPAPRYLAPLLGKKVANHFLVNNWANGWRTDNVSGKRLVIVYIPQYLEFAGIALLLLTITATAILATKRKLH
ncbi:MAG: hypothetical protein HY376_00960 [Candidatus Blackburnbacteria bacterium]|nr:hypothetical protein [Candidatus Blackburnbacteria bacterium]